MGLWLRKDGEFISVSGSSAGGGEVLTGDPNNPPEDWAAGQLLYDGVEDTGGGAGAATELTQQIVKFDTAGTFEFKKADYPNLAFVNVEAIGGGGAGGTAPANPAGESKASVGGGGGSGGYAFRTLMASDLADVESVVVGAGGTASLTRSMVDGVETVGTGSDGGASLAFGINVHGGTGGQSVQTSAGGDYLVARPGQGGSVYGDNDYGVRGGAGFAPDAQVQRSMGGNGGGVMFAVGGFGGNAVTATGQGGANGHNGGGGGGGANRANTDAVQVGGAGGDGIVVVTVFSVTGSGGGSGDGGPHDHAGYAPVEHDHDDYMPFGSIETQYFKSDKALVDVVGASQGDPTYVESSYLYFAPKPYDRTIHVDGSCPVNWVSGGTTAGRQVYVTIGYRVAPDDGFDTDTEPWLVGTPMGMDPAPLVEARTYRSVIVGRSAFVPAGERADFRIYAWRNGGSENQAGGGNMWIRGVAYPGGQASTFDIADDTSPSWYLEDGTPMYGTSEILKGA